MLKNEHYNRICNAKSGVILALGNPDREVTYLVCKRLKAFELAPSLFGISKPDRVRFRLTFKHVPPSPL